jgi:uncharacterized membrane protein (TIGR02234 family)
VIRVAQLILVVAAGALWVASRLTWVDVTSFDGLGQPRSATLAGGSWSTALVPLALLLLATAVAALAVRGWLLRLLAALMAASSAGMAYLAISLWVIPDVAPRAADLAEVPVADLIDTQRHYWGAVTTLGAAVLTLAAAVLLMRSASSLRTAPVRYAAPAARRDAVVADTGEADVSERTMWDALDEGRDPTDPDTQGR